MPVTDPALSLKLTATDLVLSDHISRVTVPLSSTEELLEIIHNIPEEETSSASAVTDRLTHLREALQDLFDTERAVTKLTDASTKEFFVLLSRALNRVISDTKPSGQDRYSEESFWLAARHHDLCVAIHLAQDDKHTDESLKRSRHVIDMLKNIEGTPLFGQIQSALPQDLTEYFTAELRQVEQDIPNSAKKRSFQKVTPPRLSEFSILEQLKERAVSVVQYMADVLSQLPPVPIASRTSSLFSRALSRKNRRLDPGGKAVPNVLAGKIEMDPNLATPLFVVSVEVPETNGSVTMLDVKFEPVRVSAEGFKTPRGDDEIDVTFPVSHACAHGVPAPMGYSIVAYEGPDTLERSEQGTWRLGKNTGRTGEIHYRLKKTDQVPPGLIDHPRARETKVRQFIHPATQRALDFAEQHDTIEEKVTELLCGLSAAGAVYTRDRSVIGRISRAGFKTLEYCDALQLYLCDNISYSFCYTMRDAGIPSVLLRGLMVKKEGDSQRLLVSEEHQQVGYFNEAGKPVVVEPQEGFNTTLDEAVIPLRKEWREYRFGRETPAGKFFKLISIGHAWRTNALSENKDLLEEVRQGTKTHQTRHVAMLLKKIEVAHQNSEIANDIPSTMKLLHQLLYVDKEQLLQLLGIKNGKLPSERLTVERAKKLLFNEIIEKVGKLPEEEQKKVCSDIIKDNADRRFGGFEKEDLCLARETLLTLIHATGDYSVPLGRQKREDFLEYVSERPHTHENNIGNYLEYLEATYTFAINALPFYSNKVFKNKAASIARKLSWSIVTAPHDGTPQATEKISQAVENLFVYAEKAKLPSKDYIVEILNDLTAGHAKLSEESLEFRRKTTEILMRHPRTAALFTADGQLSDMSIKILSDKIYGSKLSRSPNRDKYFPEYLFKNLIALGFDIAPLLSPANLQFSAYLEKYFLAPADAADTHPEYANPRGIMIPGLNDYERFPARSYLALESGRQVDINFFNVREQIYFGQALHSVAETPEARALIERLSTRDPIAAEQFAEYILMNTVESGRHVSIHSEYGGTNLQLKSGKMTLLLPHVTKIESPDHEPLLIGHTPLTTEKWKALTEEMRQQVMPSEENAPQAEQYNLRSELTKLISELELKQLDTLWTLQPWAPTGTDHTKPEWLDNHSLRYDRVKAQVFNRKTPQQVYLMERYLLNKDVAPLSSGVINFVSKMSKDKEQSIKSQQYWPPQQPNNSVTNFALSTYVTQVKDIPDELLLDLFDLSGHRAEPFSQLIRKHFSTSTTVGNQQLREIRDFENGDPYSRIAWAATAKRGGRLMAKETESNDPVRNKVIVDLDWLGKSATAGDPGKELVTLLTFLHSAVRNPDPTSLTVTYGGNVVYAIPAADLRKTMKGRGTGSSSTTEVLSTLWELAVAARELNLYPPQHYAFQNSLPVHMHDTIFLFADPISAQMTKEAITLKSGNRKGVRVFRERA